MLAQQYQWVSCSDGFWAT